MIPFILAAVGGYLIAGSLNKNITTKFGNGGVLKLYKEDNKKYYWIFTFENGKVEKSFDGFNTSADAQRDFEYRSKYFKMADGGVMSNGGIGFDQNGKTISESDKYKFEIKFLKSISKVRKGDINETINDLKKALSNEEKFIGKVPTVRQYEKDGNYVETNGESTYHYYDGAEDKIMLKYNFEVKLNDSVFGGRYIPFDTREDALNSGMKIISDFKFADGGLVQPKYAHNISNKSVEDINIVMTVCEEDDAALEFNDSETIMYFDENELSPENKKKIQKIFLV